VNRDPAARAARLLRWYPRPWRDRYGAEFAELLISDIEERPQSAGRGLDVARGGITARLAGAGLAGGPLTAPGGAAVTAASRCRQVSASLGSLAGVLALFGTVATALASQLVIDRQTLPPGTRTTLTGRLGADIVPAAVGVLLVLAAAAALPVLATLAARLRAHGPAGPSRGSLIRPAAVLLAGGWFLLAGGRHFENGWPGTGGHGSFVPAGLAAFEWAVSMSMSAYWAHPGHLFGFFPGPEAGWMTVSPLVLAATAAAAVVLVRRVRLSPRLLAFEVRLAAAACAVLPLIVIAMAVWVAASGGPAEPADPARGAFPAGLIDLAGTAVLALALPAAVQAAVLARRQLRLARIAA
jgi:hypothetical protein